MKQHTVTSLTVLLLGTYLAGGCTSSLDAKLELVRCDADVMGTLTVTNHGREPADYRSWLGLEVRDDQGNTVISRRKPPEVMTLDVKPQLPVGATDSFRVGVWDLAVPTMSGVRLSPPPGRYTLWLVLPDGTESSHATVLVCTSGTTTTSSCVGPCDPQASTCGEVHCATK